MSRKESLIAIHLWIYLVVSCIVILCTMLQAPQLIAYEFQMFTIFVLGAIGIILYDLTRKQNAAIRWGLILFASGILFLLVEGVPNLFEYYLQFLEDSPYLTIGFTAVFLGALLLFVPLLIVIEKGYRNFQGWFSQRGDEP